MVFGDKAYCLKPAQIAMKVRGAISAAILEHNIISKTKTLIVGAHLFALLLRSSFPNVKNEPGTGVWLRFNSNSLWMPLFIM